MMEFGSLELTIMSLLLVTYSTYGLHVYFDEDIVNQFEIRQIENLTLAERDYIAHLREENDEIPRPCRTDLCNEGEEEVVRKGRITWADTIVGNRLRILCPYAIYEPVYVERYKQGFMNRMCGQCHMTTNITYIENVTCSCNRECRLNHTSGPYWSDLHAQECPDPPFAQLVLKLKDEQAGEILSREYYADVLLRIKNILETYPTEHIGFDDIRDAMPIILEVIPMFYEKENMMQEKVASAFLKIFDFFFNHYKQALQNVLFISGRLQHFLEQLRLLPLIIEPSSVQMINIDEYDHFALSQQVLSLAHNSIDFNSTHETFDKKFPDIQLTLSDLSMDKYVFGTLVVKDMAFFFQNNYDKGEEAAIPPENIQSFLPPDTGFGYVVPDWNRNERSVNIDSNNDSYVGTTLASMQFRDINLSPPNKDVPSIPENLQDRPNRTKRDLILGDGGLSYAVTDIMSFTPTNKGGSEINSNDITSKLTTMKPPQTSTKVEPPFGLGGIAPEDDFTPVNDYEAYGYIVLVGMSRNGEIKETNDNLRVQYKIRCSTTKDCLTNEKEEMCVKMNDQDNWANKSCSTLRMKDGSVVCSCNGVGHFGSLLVEYNSKKNNTMVPSIPANRPTVPSYSFTWDIASFMGFTYRRNLAIIGMVLNALSLCCLICTVVSYIVIRRARKGRTTAILLNLCVALILLSLAFFTAEFMVKVRLGCTFANVIRYYLVFVTLLWNSVEAFHMYILLVKVFPGTQIMYFIYKAAVFAWGVPVLMIALCTAISTKAFNGYIEVVEQYDEYDAKCAFRCSLKPKMLYFGYLVPMIIIIMHNLVIFSLVLRVILAQGQMVAHKKRSRLIQLAGIAATLVLLGVPWIFSAFGALEIKDNAYLGALEGAVQVVFVIFINLQGLFIFIFHCARNRNIRESWSNAVSLVIRRTSDNSVSTKSSTVNGKNSISKLERSSSGHISPRTDLKLANLRYE